jgi:sulfite reductase (NADPH) flavoprotein alpha-component
MFKKVFFQLHWFLGITAGLILALMGITGAIYSYEQQILKWVNEDSYVVHAESTPKLTPNEIFKHFKETSPEFKINSITIAKDATASSSINVAKEGARRGKNIMINPYSAEILPEIKGQEFFQFIQQLHRNLTVGPVGKQITGACTLILIFFVLSGLYLRWPKKHTIKQWLAVKPKLKGRNFIWDLHAVVGTWVIVFYLILACTGLYWSYDWWRSGMFKVLGVERPQAQMQMSGPKLQQGPEHQTSTQTRGESAQNNNTHATTERKPKNKELPVETIHMALEQSWSNFNAKVGHEYSSLTFNIPKKNNDEIELSFVDPIPQHERARNKAIYNYKTSEVTTLELYEDKKLNEKIMSSMLPVHRGSFFGPVYQFFAMLASLAMPLFFVTGWMLYLKRRKQKKLTLAAKQPKSEVTIDPNAKPWLIAYASQTGVSEQLAWNTSTSLQEAHQATTVKSVQNLTVEDLQNAEQILFIVSTYGTGEAPDLANSFVRKVLAAQLDLSHLHYAVLALGSKEYADTYCSFGHQVDTWLRTNAAHPLFNLIEVDNANPEQIKSWNDALAQATHLELQAKNLDKTFDTWTLSKRTLLNPESLGAPAFSIELTTTHDTLWEAGDIAEIQPGNSAERIQAFLNQHHIAGNTHVDDLGINIQTALWNKNLTTEIKEFANLQELLEQLNDLPSREYSIASIPSQQVLRLVVRQQSNTQGELGLGSGWLTQHAELSSPIALRIRHNDAFHLIDDNRPIICIGNGTGIAGLLSLLHTRVRHDYDQNWLIFGERQQAHDFFFKETIEAWQNMGILRKLDLAFSRDQAEKVYVHHKLRENEQELKKWVSNGAVIYICGSIQGMASDVDQALHEILGDAQMDLLRQEGRYKRDVY